MTAALQTALSVRERRIVQECDHRIHHLCSAGYGPSGLETQGDVPAHADFKTQGGRGSFLTPGSNGEERDSRAFVHLTISDEEALPGRDWQQLGYEAAEPLSGFDTKFEPEELSIPRELPKSL